MLVIYKYKMRKYEEIIDAPVISWLKVDWQDRINCYCLWALVDDEASARKFKVRLIETGEHFPAEELDGYQYLDTVNKNIYVAHFFIAELNPETLEVMVEDEKEEPAGISENGNFTWSPDHLKWLDPEHWGNFLDNDITINADWTYKPEWEARF